MYDLWGNFKVSRLTVSDTSQTSVLSYLMCETFGSPLVFGCVTSLCGPQWLVGLAGSPSVCCVSVLWSSVRDDGPDLHTHEGTTTHTVSSFCSTGLKWFLSDEMLNATKHPCWVLITGTQISEDKASSLTFNLLLYCLGGSWLRSPQAEDRTEWVKPLKKS